MTQLETLAPLRASTLRENVSDLLIEAILSGKFKPGDRLNESALSRQLQVSRAPIREALHKIEEMGLVVNKSRRGMFVVNLSDEDVHKINSLRVVLEGEALALCRRRMSPAFGRKLLQLLGRMERDAPMAPLEAVRLDLEFHRAIWSNTGNEFLERTLIGLTAPLFADALVRRMGEEKMRMILDSHRPLFEFLQSSADLSEARRIIYRHVSLREGKPDAYLAEPPV